MSLFSRLFAPKRKVSRLEDFLSRLTSESIREASMKTKGGHGVAFAISLLVLQDAYRFATGLVDMSAKFSKSLGAGNARLVDFDVVAFEVAAFTHYALFAPYIDDEDEDEDEDDGYDDEGGEKDPYFAVLKDAAHLSARLMDQHTDFGLHEDFFINRSLAYSMPRRLRGRANFEHVLSASIEAGSPKAGLGGGLSLRLDVDGAVKICVPLHQTHSTPAMVTATRQIYDHAEELGLSR